MFEWRNRAASAGFNPRGGESIEVPGRGAGVPVGTYFRQAISGAGGPKSHGPKPRTEAVTELAAIIVRRVAAFIAVAGSGQLDAS